MKKFKDLFVPEPYPDRLLKMRNETDANDVDYIDYCNIANCVTDEFNYACKECLFYHTNEAAFTKWYEQNKPK